VPAAVPLQAASAPRGLRLPVHLGDPGRQQRLPDQGLHRDPPVPGGYTCPSSIDDPGKTPSPASGEILVLGSQPLAAPKGAD
jgi:hypothetical protein